MVDTRLQVMHPTVGLISQKPFVKKVSTCYVFVKHCVCAISGARAETSARGRGGDGYNQEGVSGLKALGVRDLSYKMAFLACHAKPCNVKVL